MFPPKRELDHTLSSLRKMITVLAKTITGSDNGKIKRKERKDFKSVK
jgi:hypothetical protein